METLTQIANLALVEIQKDPIKNLDVVAANPNASSPRQKVEALINTVLPSVIEEVQSSSRWSCLTAKETLNLISSPTDDDPVYVYAYPEGILVEITLVSGYEYEVVGNTLRTDDPAAILWRVRRSDSPTEWNVHLTKAIYLELAARIAPKLAEDVNIILGSRQRADQALIDCTAKDYTNRATPREMGSYFELNQARNGASGRYSGTGRNHRLRSSMNISRYG